VLKKRSRVSMGAATGAEEEGGEAPVTATGEGSGRRRAAARGFRASGVSGARLRAQAAT